MGSGRDLVTGRSLITLLAVDRWNGNLEMGRGDDLIDGTHGPLLVGEDSVVTTGAGNDRITAAGLVAGGGLVDAGPGDDLIDLGHRSINCARGGVRMGDGDDRLLARAGLTLSDASHDLGAGDDVVDLGTSGINLWDSPSDALRLGSENDRLIGFATSPSPGLPASSTAGMVRGGKGKDVLVLPEGVYTVTEDRVSVMPYAFDRACSATSLQRIVSAQKKCRPQTV